MNPRYLGAILLSPLLIFLFVGGIYLKYMVMILALLGLYEFYKVVKKKGIHPVEWPVYILSIFYFISLSSEKAFPQIIFALIFLLFLLLCVPIINTEINFIDISITIFGFLYIVIFFSFIPLVSNKAWGGYLLWLIFISSWLCDTSAYYVGRAFGKNKISPKVSPNKTIEGSIGGVLGSTLACGIFGSIIARYGVNIPLYHFYTIGLICGVFCQFGDLIASSIKRYVDVKDYSNLIPGHGGILDRFDSILFASVMVYYYITFIIGI